jgi:hypothetical protein
VDDRTGIVFEVADMDPDAAKADKKSKGSKEEAPEGAMMGEPVVVPRWIIMEGDGL